MTDTQIEQANEVIARFVGWELIDGRIGKFIKDNHTAFPYMFKYHSDWNQIHSVWEKFRSLKISEVDEGFNDHYSRYLQAISVALHALPIAAVHERLFRAIQWYNNTLNKQQ